MNHKNPTSPISRVFDLLPYIREKYNREIVFASRQNGRWKTVSTSEYISSADQVSFALLKLGITKGDTIVTITNNRPEFNFMDMGSLQIGAVLVPLYTGLSDSKLLGILTETECRVIVVSTKQLAAKIQSLHVHLPCLEQIISYEPAEGGLLFSDLLKLGRENTDFNRLQAARDAVLPSDAASVIYISGATTPVKGVVLTHQSHVSNMLQYAGNPHMEGMTACLSILPLAHSYERTINYCQQYFGLSIYYNEKIPGLFDELKEVKPEILVMVPMLLGKVFSTLEAKSKQGGFRERKLLPWALGIAEKAEPGINPGWQKKLKLFLANRLVFSSWNKTLGGKVKVVLCGGAALQPRLLNIFHAAGIPVYEGYGITEAGPLVSYNTKTGFKPYTLGKLMPGVEVQVAPDGELLVKSPSLMPAYFKNTTGTFHVIAPEGWLRTGDLGEIDNDGFLKITGIKKEIFKLSSGIYVSPAAIEERLQESTVIRQAWVYGHNRDFLSAIIIPETTFVNLSNSGLEINAGLKNDLPNHEQLLTEVQNAIKKYNSSSRGPDQVLKFALAKEDWTVENGLINETGELNRSAFQLFYHSQIESFYE